MCKNYRERYTGDYNDLQYGVQCRTIDYIARILLFSGLPKGREEAEATVIDLAGKEIELLWKLVSNLSEKVKEQVSSTDYQLFFIQSADDYDERYMRNQGSASAAKAKGSGNIGQKVLCTVELGVKRVTNPAKPGERNDGKLEEVVMEKAVVIFESEAEAL